jgi:Fic family protein
MKSFSEEYLNKLPVTNEIVRMIRRIGEYKGKQELFQKQSPEMLENLRQVAIVQSIESSNRLEQVTAEPKRLKEIIEEKTKPQNRSEAEIAGYRDVLNLIHSSDLNIPFTEKVIQQFHRDIMKYTGLPGGNWKMAQNEIIERGMNGQKRIRFLPVEPFQVQNYMTTLHQRFNKEIVIQNIDSLILIPLYILDFLCIHPFTDGNGRISRLATVLLLHQQGYQVVRYISLERIIENTKDSYYETLESSSTKWHEGKHDNIPWVSYFLSILLAAYDEFERRADLLISGKGSKTEMVIRTIDSFLGEFSVSDIQKNCPVVSLDMIRLILKKLKSDGKIQIISRGRTSKWKKIIR